MKSLIPRNKDGTFQKGYSSPKKNGEYRICQCGKSFYISSYRVIDKTRGKFCSSKCGYKANKGKRASIVTEFKKGVAVNENHPNWKGDSVGYYALHTWIQRRYGKADYCENGHISKRYVWANISGLYKRDISDWKKVCNSCNMRDGVRVPERFTI